MDYASLLISAIVFFMSLSLLVMTWAKKPTKKHIKEIEEAGAEIVQQIQEATEESIMKIEGKIQELDEKMTLYKKKNHEIQVKQQETIVQEVKEIEVSQQKTKESSQGAKVNIDMKDKKVQQLYELYSKGYKANQIAKELGMYAGVVEVYVNLFEMNKAM
ncbi:hypothetical protein CN918_27770 [Priestia megaterium]|nr:hypothetical protein CN918_27770 [Priestia megaterium]